MTGSNLSNRLHDYGVILYAPVRLRGGEHSQFYADIKKAYGDPELLGELSAATYNSLNPQTTCLAVSGYGGLPLGVIVSQLSGLPLAMVRDAEKDHGKKGLIDGYVPTAEDKVSLLDDVFTSGGSLAETAEAVSSTGAAILGCHVIVARGDTSQFKYPVSALLSPEDIA